MTIRYRYFGWLLCAVLALSLTGALCAQDKSDSQGSGLSTSNQETSDASSSSDAADADRERKRSGHERPDRADRGADRGSGRGNADVRQFMEQQAQYRMRTAKINRLRQLAREHGDEDKVRKLDELQEKAETLHRQQVDRFQDRVGDEKFDRIQKHIKQRHEEAAARRGDRQRGARDGERRGDREDRADRQGERRDSADRDRPNRGDRGDRGGDRGDPEKRDQRRDGSQRGGGGGGGS